MQKPIAIFCGSRRIGANTLTLEPETMKHYITYADRDTGEWLTQPELIGDVDGSEWRAERDTDFVHFDTFEIFSDDGQSETAAIAVYWRN
jgi:hypothetical protein